MTEKTDMQAFMTGAVAERFAILQWLRARAAELSLIPRTVIEGLAYRVEVGEHLDGLSFAERAAQTRQPDSTPEPATEGKRNRAGARSAKRGARSS